MDNASLDRAWTPQSLLLFAFPSIVMMLFMGLYTAVDTIFAARFVNTDALSAINIVCPMVNLTVGFATMIATGGNALVSRKMGEGRFREARQDFTLLILAGITGGVLLTLFGTLFLDELLRALGASPRLFPYCKAYLQTLLLFLPASVLQTLFSNLFVTAGRPGLGFALSLLAGIANIVLDYIFMVPCALGIRGAALGTGVGYLIPALSGLIFFARTGGPLSFTRPRWSAPTLLEACFNGSSEMVSQLSSAVTTYLFNHVMLALRGEPGVAAITILIYAQFLLNTLFIGYSIGVAPVIGFLHGSGDAVRQKKVLRISLAFIAGASIAIFAISRLGGAHIAALFATDSPEVLRMASDGFAIFSYSFLFCGVNIFTSAMFTALSNGRLSAALSFLRTFGLLAGGILLLPRVFGIIGVWLAVPVAEFVMFFVSCGCFAYPREEHRP